MSGISENISEKPRRGRPRLLSKELEQIAIFKDGPYCSPRTHQNGHYEIRALRVLDITGDQLPEEYRWLMDPDKQREGRSERQGYRKTILAELGRIDDDECLQAVAKRICELKPKTRDAILMIRRWRVGGSKPADVRQLANEVIRTINDYLQRHPSTTHQQVLTALTEALEIVEEHGGEG